MFCDDIDFYQNLMSLQWRPGWETSNLTQLTFEDLGEGEGRGCAPWRHLHFFVCPKKRSKESTKPRFLAFGFPALHGRFGAEQKLALLEQLSGFLPKSPVRSGCVTGVGEEKLKSFSSGQLRALPAYHFWDRRSSLSWHPSSTAPDCIRPDSVAREPESP